MAWRLAAHLWKGHKADVRERVAANWPSVPGRIRGGSLQMLDSRWQVELTYEAFEAGQGVGLWRHRFLSREEAHHALSVLRDSACQVHFNPESAEDTTLLWSEMKTALAGDPYLPRMVPLGRVGYRWLFGLAALANAGLLSTLILYGVAMSGSKICVCDVMMTLLTAAPFVALGSLVPMGRILAGAPVSSVWRRLVFLMHGWGVCAMAIGCAATAASLLHFGPAFRALPIDALVSDKLFAGALGVLAVPCFLFAGIVAVQGLQRLRPVSLETRIPTAV